jgi:hypothetical protein
MDRTFGWEYPPGVSESDIPGNRPEDLEWEHAMELAMHDIVDVCSCFRLSPCPWALLSEEAEYEGCELDIVTIDEKIGKGDIGDCPYVEKRAQEIVEMDER